MSRTLTCFTNWLLLLLCLRNVSSSRTARKNKAESTRGIAMHHKKDTVMGNDCKAPIWDHSSHEKFYSYYAEASQGQQALQRFGSTRDVILRVLTKGIPIARPLKVVEIGCGAGTLCMMWAELGHHAHGVDVNEPLVGLAQQRAASAGYTIDFQVGSAAALGWADASMDICIALELL